MHCLENVSRQLMFASQFLEFGKFAFQSADLGPTLHHQIYQRTDEKITLGTKPLSLALVGYPLLTEDLPERAGFPEALAKLGAGR